METRPLSREQFMASWNDPAIPLDDNEDLDFDIPPPEPLPPPSKWIQALTVVKHNAWRVESKVVDFCQKRPSIAFILCFLTLLGLAVLIIIIVSPKD